MFSNDRSFRLAAVLAVGLGLASVASAGPPLICHPFTTGTGAPLLPWAEGTNNWHLPDHGYDRANLVADTLSLLSADAHAEALEWFDAGYLVETYRQLGLIYEHKMLPPQNRWTSLVPDELAELDGYELVQKAIALAPTSRAELEFASALMSREPLTATHLRSAASSAAAGSLLAQNLAHYDVR